MESIRHFACLKTGMRGTRVKTAVLIVAALTAMGCQTESQREAERRREEQDRGSAAFRAGEVAHRAADEAARLAAAAGRKLDEGARKAHEGWREESRRREDREDRSRP